MDTSIKYRTATSKDVSGMVDCHIRTWQQDYRGMFSDSFLDSMSQPENQEKRIAHLMPLLETNSLDSFTFIALDGSGKICGFVSSGRNRNADETNGEIYSMYVDGCFQHRGIGSTLFKMAADEFSRQGYGSFVVWTLRDTPKSNSFYTGLGGIPNRTGTLEYAGVRLLTCGYDFSVPLISDGKL